MNKLPEVYVLTVVGNRRIAEYAILEVEGTFCIASTDIEEATPIKIQDADDTMHVLSRENIKALKRLKQQTQEEQKNEFWRGILYGQDIIYVDCDDWDKVIEAIYDQIEDELKEVRNAQNENRN